MALSNKVSHGVGCMLSVIQEDAVAGNLRPEGGARAAGDARVHGTGVYGQSQSRPHQPVAHPPGLGRQLGAIEQQPRRIQVILRSQMADSKLDTGGSHAVSLALCLMAPFDNKNNPSKNLVFNRQPFTIRTFTASGNLSA